MSSGNPSSLGRDLARGGICALAFLFVLLALLPVRYATNDDISLLGVLNGTDGYAPDAFAVFNGFFLNRILFHLYRVLPDLPWWGLSVYTALTAATALVFALLFRVGRAALPALPALLYFLGLCFAYAGITSATLLLLVGVLLWLHAMALSREAPFPALFSACLALCLGAALMMRWQIAVFFLVFALPLLAVARGPALKRMLVILLCAGAVLCADRAAFSATVTPPEREFLDYNGLRARFHDTPSGDFHPGVTERALKTARWTPEDYEFFHDWVLYDDSLFNRARLETFLEANAASPGLYRALSEGARHMAANAWGAKKNLALLLLALGGLLAWARPRGGQGGWMPWLLPLACLPALLFFIHYRFVERVYLPLFLLMAVAALLSLRETSASPSLFPSWGRNLGIALQVAVVLFFSFRQAHALREDRREADFVSECLRKQAGSTIALLDPGTGLGLEKIHPLRERALPPGAALFPDGFWVGSPRYRRILVSRGFAQGRPFLRGAAGNAEIDWVLLENASTRPVKNTGEILSAWEGYYRRNLGVPMRLRPRTSCLEPGGRALRFYRMTAVP